MMEWINAIAEVIGYFWLLVAAGLVLAGIYQLQVDRYHRKLARRGGYLDQLYGCIWTGREEDRIYAWYRVIGHLKAWNYDEGLIAEALERIEQLKAERTIRMYIARDGRLIERTEIL